MFKKGERSSFSFSNENVLLVYLNDQKSLNFSAWLREENNRIVLSKHRLQNLDFNQDGNLSLIYFQNCT